MGDEGYGDYVEGAALEIPLKGLPFGIRLRRELSLSKPTRASRGNAFVLK